MDAHFAWKVPIKCIDVKTSLAWRQIGSPYAILPKSS